MPFCPKGDTYVSTCAKYTLFVINLIFWLAGGVIVGSGAWALIERNKYEVTEFKSVTQFVFDVSILFIVIGSIVFIVAFFGFVGALRENTCLLRFFTYSLIAIFLVEIALAVYTFIQKDQVKEALADAIKDAYILPYLDSNKEDNNAVANHVQENFKCCGATTYLDWNQNEYFNCTEQNKSGWRCAVPYSCCRQQDNVNTGDIINTKCGGGALNQTKSTSHIYVTGCLDAAVELAETNLIAIVAVALAILLPQLVGMFLGRQLTTQIEDQWARYRRAMHR